ncbi:MAG: RluA family pseudouridine synthase [Candidatus Babeliales bacterium]
MASTQHSEPTHYQFIVPQETEPIRLDTFISKQLPNYSRTFIQKLIEDKHITINDKTAKPSTLIKSDDVINIHIPPVTPFYETELTAETKEKLNALGIEIVYTHPDFFIINKPAGVIVHKPSTKSNKLTLVDWLMFHAQELANVGHPERPGIVHRLDKDTSGLMIVPRNNYAHNIFSDMFKNRQIKKTYLAIVQGHPDPKGIIDLPIGRDPVTRNKMTVNGIKARPSKTNYKVIEYLKDATLVEAYPVTGRTHQIRVHFNAIGHPLIGDQLYGKKSKHIKRHALHATQLSFTYNNNLFNFTSEMPQDLRNLVDTLK